MLTKTRQLIYELKHCSCHSSVAVFAAVLLWFSTSMAANQPLADVSVTTNGVSVQAAPDVTFIQLRISGPQGVVYDQSSNGGSLQWTLGGSLVNGVYTWEVKASTAKQQQRRTDDASSLPSATTVNSESDSSSGSFSILNQSIVPPDVEETGFWQRGLEGLNKIAEVIGDFILPSAYADNVVADDQIVQGSLCVGFDCVNGEDFSFDTLRLKENNLRIKFDDTSATAGFPANDWQITANDSASGGANKFSIEDITAARVPFTLTAGAPSNSLFVSSTGNVGLGTATPVLDLHVATGNTPALRLEQDGTSGFTAQTWDIAGNEANFFIRDVTGGSKLPFRIQPGAPSNSVYIKNDGSVGLGTAAPGFPLHVSRTGSNASIVLDRSDGVRTFVNGTATHGNLGTVTNHPLRLQTNATVRMTMNTDNSLTMANGASLSAGGVWTNASSRDLKENVVDLTPEEARLALADLNPVKYNYRNVPSEGHVGFIAEDVPEILATQDRKGLSPMDIVAMLTKVVQEQQKSIDMLSAQVQAMKVQAQTDSMKLQANYESAQR